MKNIGENRRKKTPVAPSTETTQLKSKRQRTRLDDSMYLTTSEIQDLFRVIENQQDRSKMRRDRAMFRLVYHRGLRIHEVRLLQLADFRDRDGLLFVHRGKGSI